VTRAGVLLAAVQHEIESRRASIDRAEDLAEVTVTLRLQAGTSWLRGVVWREERLCREPRRGVQRAIDTGG